MKNNKFSKSIMAFVVITTLLSQSNTVMGMGYLWGALNKITATCNYIENNNLIEKAVTHPKIEPYLNQKMLSTYCAFYGVTGYSFAGPAKTIVNSGLENSINILKWGFNKITGHVSKKSSERVYIGFPSDGVLPLKAYDSVAGRHNQMLRDNMNKLTPQTDWLRYAAGAYALTCGVYRFVKWSQEDKEREERYNIAIKKLEESLKKDINATEKNIISETGIMIKKSEEKIIDDLSDKIANCSTKEDLGEINNKLIKIAEQNKLSAKTINNLKRELNSKINNFEKTINDNTKMISETCFQAKITNFTLEECKNMRNDINSKLNKVFKDCKSELDIKNKLVEDKISSEYYVNQVDLLKVLNEKIKEKEGNLNFQSEMRNYFNNSEKQMHIIEENTNKTVVNVVDIKESIEDDTRKKLMDDAYQEIKQNILLSKKTNNNIDNFNDANAKLLFPEDSELNVKDGIFPFDGGSDSEDDDILENALEELKNAFPKSKVKNSKNNDEGLDFFNNFEEFAKIQGEKSNNSTDSEEEEDSPIDFLYKKENNELTEKEKRNYEKYLLDQKHLEEKNKTSIDDNDNNENTEFNFDFINDSENEDFGLPF